MKKHIFILSGVVALVDQVVKILASNFLAGNTSIPIIKDFFYLTYVENTGAAWGILSGNRYFLIIIAILAIYGIVKYFLLDVNITKLEFVAYSLILGGVIGNLIDRILYGFVVDYADFRFGDYNFPVFNIADAAIVIGAGLVIFHLIRNAVKQRRV
ncbi:MAG: signal peptidase II [Bacilli bacterium]|nr:signal peptidase II [Bacilli bacterium]MDD3305020.1 signal peptidase II [Bacilli bacterium]MDD4053649.1 signal peptidase II [Bacilli bacterium]MDD4411148.1 signal peptidase II [Bacilli bacterium]